jgi:hypothetical protein
VALYVLEPSLTNAPEPARAFIQHFLSALPTELTVRLSQTAQLQECSPTREDSIVFCCSPTPGVLDVAVQRFLSRSLKANAYIAPVAVDRSCRQPPDIIKDHHAFDVVDWAKRRELHTQHVALTAEDFAYTVLAATRPTCAAEDLNVFISYKRGDSEESVRVLEQNLHLRRFRLQRDLVDIQVGSVVAEAIDECVRRADAILLIDTPAAAQSDWIRWEIEIALRHAVPIIWVMCGDTHDRRNLPLQPADSPDLYLEDISSESASDRICEAIRARTLQHVRETQQLLDYAEECLAQSGARLVSRDRRRQIYEVRFPVRRAGGYPVRTATDLLQLYGRRPREEDIEAFRQYIISEDLGPHSSECRAFDAAVILSPRCTRSLIDDSFTLIEDGHQYLRNLPHSMQAAERDSSSGPRKLLLIGSFPESADAQAQCNIAVREVSEQWMDNGGQLVFGGHPTFAAIISGAANRLEARGGAPDVEVYLSRWFADDLADAEARDLLKRIWIDAEGSRNASLRRMRVSMIAGSNPHAAVAIGGRRHANSENRPGVPEEIAIAREHGIPCFLLGSTGGATSELAGKRFEDPSGWVDLGNDLGVDGNRSLAMTNNYRAACQVIWKSVID